MIHFATDEIEKSYYKNTSHRTRKALNELDRMLGLKGLNTYVTSTREKSVQCIPDGKDFTSKEMIALAMFVSRNHGTGKRSCIWSRNKRNNGHFHLEVL